MSVRSDQATAAPGPGRASLGQSFPNPLTRFASDCSVGVLLVTHTRKTTSARSTHRVQATILGSVDYVAASRSALVVQKDPKTEKETAGIVTHAKCNFGSLGQSLSFLIGAEGWKWGEERAETGGDGRRGRSRQHRQKGARKEKRIEVRVRIEKEIRTYLEANEGGRDFHQGVERERGGEKRHDRQRVERTGRTRAIETAQARKPESAVELDQERDFGERETPQKPVPALPN